MGKSWDDFAKDDFSFFLKHNVMNIVNAIVTIV